MRKTPYNKHPKTFKCRSGLTGWTCKLQANYHSFESFKSASETWGLHTRLGYKTIEGAWKANPQICGSVNPNDFRKVK